jgi:hypothetical protein
LLHMDGWHDMHMHALVNGAHPRVIREIPEHAPGLSPTSAPWEHD